MSDFEKPTIYASHESGPQTNNVCVWTEKEMPGVYVTQCGEIHEFTFDGPYANRHRFCPYCGHRIKEKQ